MRVWLGWLGCCTLAGRDLLLPFFFSFLFFISLPLFEFKFGLKFKFQTDVTYSLEFREFCLAILYINIGVVCYIHRISFPFITHLTLDLNSDYFMGVFPWKELLSIT
jgi:hypothetical protein